MVQFLGVVEEYVAGSCHACIILSHHKMVQALQDLEHYFAVYGVIRSAKNKSCG